jgi:DNA-directed RNA polymerase subunit RPC12/RpoP
MAEPPQPDASHEIVCPHCKKTFEAALLQGENVRRPGFKCPHCRLFVAWGRVEEQNPTSA